jgi:hypothetical protein
MPSAITFNGNLTRRPGVYATIDVSALQQNTLSINRVAIVADMPFLKPNTAKTITTQNGLKSIEPASAFLKNVAKILYNPANDDRVSGKPSAVILISPNASTQAFKVLLGTSAIGSSSGNSATIKARAYGEVGNRTTLSIAAAAGTTDTKLRDMTVSRDGVSETFTKLGSGPVVELKVEGNALYGTGDVELTYTRTGGLQLDQTLQGAPASALSGTGSSFTTAFGAGATLLTSDVLKINCAGNASIAGTDTHTVTVTGLNELGAATTETLGFSSGDDAKTTTAKWSQITSIAGAAAASGATTFTFVPRYTVGPSALAKVSDLVDLINSFSANGLSATTVNPAALDFPFNKLDDFTTTDINVDSTPGAGVASSFRADLYQTVSVINGKSALVSIAEETTPKAGPLNAISTTLASGTQEAAPAGSSWETALTVLRNKTLDPQVIVVMSTDQAIAKSARAHCAYMAGVGANECNVWVGQPSLAALGDSTTASSLVANVNALNSRHVSTVFQDIFIEDALGESSWFPPQWTALMLAGIQAGTDIGIPMTRKLANVLNVRQNANINLSNDIETLLQHGLVTLMPSTLGFQVERSVTTYLTTDNAVFSEVSANESVNTSIRDLRAYLDSIIGDPNVSTTKGRIKSTVLARLEKQVETDIIKAFQGDSVEVEDLGDRYRVKYVAAPVFPINFVLIEATFVSSI